jgi:hypothetical protein
MDGEAEYDPAAERVVMTSPSWPEPVELRGVSQRTLERAVSISADDRDALWPDADLDAAGMNLLLVHLDEMIGTGEAATGVLTLHRGHLAVEQSAAARLRGRLTRRGRRRRPRGEDFSWQNGSGEGFYLQASSGEVYPPERDPDLP